MTSPFWSVASVVTNRVDLVQDRLKREGIETYAPKIRNGKRVEPLFPGYLLCHVVLRWYPIRWCPGVTRLLMNGEQPAVLPDHVVADIRRQEVRGIVKLPKPPGTIERGQRVRITVGMFAGHIAVYQGMSGEQRERVLLEWLGRSVAAILPKGSVEAV